MNDFQVAADCLPDRLVGWATQMASRFCRPVYVCGSALELPDPRDVDLRIVLADDEWELRYGSAVDYVKGCWHPKLVPGMRRYFEDMAKLQMQGVKACRVNLDFQVHPHLFAEQFSMKLRRRIDVCDGLEEVGAFARHPCPAST